MTWSAPAPSQATPSEAAPVGRPRDDSRDAVILEAVRGLLAERGYQALSVQEVTRRAGVHVRTVGRRWPTKAELVAAAILQERGTGGPRPPTGDLRADLRAAVVEVARFLGEPATAAALPALWGELRANSELRAQFAVRQREWQEQIESILRAAVETGTAPGAAPDRRDLLSHITAASLFNAIVVLESDPAGLVDELTDFLVAGLSCSTVAPT